MKCTDIKDKLTDLLFEELTDEDRQLTEKHIQSCDSCKAEYDELRITKNILVEMEEIEIKDLNAYQQQSEEPRAQKYAALHHNLLDSQMVA